ncbi:MAG: hypothetical protein O2877_02410 [bacterium]|nr:hypothetical protein [bacterium]
MAEEANTKNAQAAKVPDEVYAFIDDPKQLDVIDELLRDHGLGDDAFSAVAPIQNLVAEGRMDPAFITERLEKKLNLPPDKAHALAVDIVKKLLLPIRKFIPSIEEVVLKWGIEEKIVPRVKSGETMSASSFVEAQIAKYDLVMPTEVLQKRFEKILVDFVSEKITKEKAIEKLIRDRGIGGLELHEGATKKLLTGFAEDLKEITIGEPKKLPPRTIVKPQPDSKESKPVPASVVPKVEIKEVVQAEKTVIAKPPAPAVTAPVVTEPKAVMSVPKEVVTTPVETTPKKTFDATTIHPNDEKEIEEHQARIPTAGPLNDINKAIAEVIKALPKVKEYGSEDRMRLEGLVKTRLNGVRDAYATRAILEESKETGGLAMEGSDLSTTLGVIEGVFDRLNLAVQESSDKDREAFVAKRQARHMDEPVLPRVSAIRTSSEQQFEKQRREKAKEPVGPKPLVVKKGKIKDIVAPRRLSGPLEELGEMSISEFRRLGQGIEDSANGVLERINLLQDESYGRRLDGISAWRKSPIYQTYTSLVTEAMQDQKPIEDVLAQHKSAGEDTLTKEEVQAFIKLNSSLRT